MDVQAVSMEIVKIRSRLREIDKQRERAGDEDLTTKADLHDEELELRARLAELQEATTEKGSASKDIAAQRKGKKKPEEFVSPA